MAGISKLIQIFNKIENPPTANYNHFLLKFLKIGMIGSVLIFIILFCLFEIIHSDSDATYRDRKMVNILRAYQ